MRATYTFTYNLGSINRSFFKIVTDWVIEQKSFSDK